MALLGGNTVLGGADGALFTWGTVADIISDAALELGLAFQPITDPYSSPDQNVLQLCALLKSAGKAVVRERGWTHLQREFTFDTVANQDTYPLPSDFREMISQSGWDRTTLYELGGPIGAVVWQSTKAIHVVGSIYPFIRFTGGNLRMTPMPTGVATIAFEYISWFWVKPTGEPEPSTDTPSAADDVVCFNEDLMVRALKLAFKKAKGMDTTTEQADYGRALASEMNADAASPVITFGKEEETPAQSVWGNIPIGGIGQ